MSACKAEVIPFNYIPMLELAAGFEPASTRLLGEGFSVKLHKQVGTQGGGRTRTLQSVTLLHSHYATRVWYSWSDSN